MDYATIPGFEQLSKQQLFDMSAKHLLTTRQKSFNGGAMFGCVYTGSGCAAAPFLRPECRAAADRDGSWKFVQGKSNHEENFVTELQGTHDGVRNSSRSFMKEWKENMRKVAYNHNLSTALIDADDKENGNG